MEQDPFLSGLVSVSTGFSGSDRILIGDYLGGIIKMALFISIVVVYLLEPSTLKGVLVGIKTYSVLVAVATLLYLFDTGSLLMKLSSSDKITTVFGKTTIWTNTSDTARYIYATVLFFFVVGVGSTFLV